MKSRYRNNHRDGEDLKTGDLVYDRYHRRRAIVVRRFGSGPEGGGYFVELHDGLKVAAQYMDKLN